MTVALPAAPAAAPRRQLLVATALACAAGFMVIIGMLAVWMKFRAGAPTRASSDALKTIKDWLPANVSIPEVASNVMLATFPIGCIMAQWAVYSAKRRDSQHNALAYFVCGMLGVAVVNAQIAVYSQMEIGIADGTYQTMFYAITGTMLLFVAGGIAFSLVAFFRSVGGRSDEVHVATAHAMYWYFLTAAFTAMWFVVYVQK